MKRLLILGGITLIGSALAVLAGKKIKEIQDQEDIYEY